jgi:ribosome-binding ATPase YchF (GTP1/OBG family)
MPTQDETPTVEVEADPVIDMATIDGELELWRARLVLARRGVGERTVKTCIEACDRWLDMKLDARGR